MIAIIVEDLYSYQTVGGKLYLDLAAFPILAYGKALIGITHPRNICNQCLFMSCAGVIKQALNYSF